MFSKAQVLVIALISFAIGAVAAYLLAPQLRGQIADGDRSSKRPTANATANGDNPNASNSSGAATSTAVTTGPIIDWPQLRGANGQGDGTESTIPTKWNDQENIVWKTKLVGRGASSPIIVGNRIFLTAYTGFGLAAGEKAKKSDLRLHLICFDRMTGKQNWTRSIQGSSAAQPTNENFLIHGSASSTPICDGERVYACFGVSGVFAFDVDGEFLWQADIGSSTHNFGSSASPMIYKDLLIVNASIESKKIFAFAKQTGKVRWILDNVVESWSTPSIGVSAQGRTELVVNQSFFVHGINPLTGEKYWTCDGIQDYVVPQPVIDGDMAYVSGGKQSRIMGIRLGGSGNVTETNKLWESPLVGNVPTPIFLDGKLFVVGENGIFQEFSAETGKLLKKKRVKSKQKIFAPLIKSRDHFFVSTPGIGVTVIDQTNLNTIVESNQPDAESARVQAGCSIAGNNLFYRTDDWIYCVGEHAQPATENKLVIDEVKELLVAKPKADLDEAQGKSKLYVRYMSGTKKATIDLVLRPYDSIITLGEEREKLNELVGSHWDRYVAIRADETAILMKQNTIPDVDYVAKFADIEKRMMALDREVRGKVRPTFSKEQMDKHHAEHEAWLKKQAAKKK